GLWWAEGRGPPGLWWAEGRGPPGLWWASSLGPPYEGRHATPGKFVVPALAGRTARRRNYEPSPPDHGPRGARWTCDGARWTTISVLSATSTHAWCFSPCGTTAPRPRA